MSIETVAIVGAGAVGIYYGARLAEAGVRVKFLLRSDYEVVSKKGFVIESVDGDFSLEEPEVFRDAAEIGAVDLVIVAWKATANHFAKEILPPLLHEKTRILSLQNGLGNEAVYEELVGRGRVLCGLCFVCINRVGPGHVKHTGGGAVTIGESAPTGVLDEVVSLFGTKVKVTATESLPLAQWKKLLWNIPFNGLCISHGAIDTAALLAKEEAEAEVRALMVEVIAAAAAQGLEIPESFIEQQVESTRKMGAYWPSSVLDFRGRRPIELAAIWEEPVRVAYRAGFVMKQTAALAVRLRELDAAR